MKLETFIAETLKQIVAGVKSAQKDAEEHGAMINPPIRGEKLLRPLNNSATIVQQVEFDVALTTSEGTTTSGGLGIFVGYVGIGARGESDAASASTSRIKFSVPVSLP